MCLLLALNVFQIIHSHFILGEQNMEDSLSLYFL